MPPTTARAMLWLIASRRRSAKVHRRRGVVGPGVIGATRGDARVAALTPAVDHPVLPLGTVGAAAVGAALRGAGPLKVDDVG